MAGERVSARDARARRVEWIVAAVAGGVVVALIAHLVHAALVLEDAPVALRVEVGPAEGGVRSAASSVSAEAEAEAEAEVSVSVSVSAASSATKAVP